MKENINIKDALGNKVSGVLSVPKNSKAVVIFSHGFTSNKNSNTYKIFEKELNKKGVGTLRYDYYGHGSNYPNKYGVTQDITLTKAVESLRAMIKYVRKKGNYKIGLFGSSFGGLVTLVATSADPGISAAILRSPVVEPISFWQKRLGKKKLAEWEKAGTLRYQREGHGYELNWSFWEDLQNYRTLMNAKKIKCPVMIIHGDSDDITPLSGSKKLAKILGVKVKVIKNAGHDFRDPKIHLQMRNLTEDFILTNMDD